MRMKLTPEERERILGQLRDDALADLRAHGCTCDPEPVMTPTAKGFGPYDLPMWQSDHADACEFARAMQAIAPNAETVLMPDPSARRRLGL